MSRRSSRSGRMAGIRRGAVLLLLGLWPVVGAGQLVTRRAGWMDEDRFHVRFLFSQFESSLDTRFGREYLINPRIGLTRKVEFEGWVPVLHMQDPERPEQAITTLGDILGDLRFAVGRFWYRLPFLQGEGEETVSFLHLYLGFGFATGPKKAFAEGYFHPYALGLPEFRWGVVSGNYAGRWEWHLNLFHTYAAMEGETFFPVEGKIWYVPPAPKDRPETPEERAERWKKSVILFNIHKVLIKWFWPGPTYWGEWPMRDDFVLYNAAVGYWLEDGPWLFRHRLALELNGLQAFDGRYCQRRTQLDVGVSVTTRFTKGLRSWLGVVWPVVVGIYEGPRFFVGGTLSL